MFTSQSHYCKLVFRGKLVGFRIDELFLNAHAFLPIFTFSIFLRMCYGLLDLQLSYH
uniref:Uncharacterized protein n=1 Tax=Rhizophora mucronata TaxID=61149 RepID=A0A2P2Q9E0_RHIMU